MATTIGTLAQLGNAQRALAAASTLEDVLSIRDQAEALRVYVKAAGEGFEAANAAAEFKLNAERKAGGMLKAMEKAKENQHTKKVRPTTMVGCTLKDLGITYNQSSRWQAEAKVPDAKFNAYLEDCKENKKELTQAGLLKIAHGTHVSTTGENEWYTPSEIIEAARSVMGSIDLDPASCKAAQKTVRAGKFFSIGDDGLSKKWLGNVWLNPPYSKDCIKLFSDKVVQEKENFNQAVVLVNNATETEWFQNMASYANGLCFPKGRIQFTDKTGQKKNSPVQGQCFIYFGKKKKTFLRVFVKIGLCF